MGPRLLSSSRVAFAVFVCPVLDSSTADRSILAILLTMARSRSLPAWMAVSGLLFAWLAGGQTQTIYLTQTQTVFTSCDCPGAILSPLSVSLADSQYWIGS